MDWTKTIDLRRADPEYACREKALRMEHRRQNMQMIGGLTELAAASILGACSFMGGAAGKPRW